MRWLVTLGAFACEQCSFSHTQAQVSEMAQFSISLSRPHFCAAMAQGERFLIGSVGQQYILSALSSSSQPFKVIEEFQKTHGVHLKEDKRCSPAYSFLVCVS